MSASRPLLQVGRSNNLRELTNFDGTNPMISHHIHADLARERQNSLLAKAEAYRRAKQARLHRQRAGTPDARRSPLHWLPGWLLSSRSRRPFRPLLDAAMTAPPATRPGNSAAARDGRAELGLVHRPQRPASGKPVMLRDGSPVVLRDGSQVLIRQVQSTDAPLLADGFTRLSLSCPTVPAPKTSAASPRSSRPTTQQ